MLFKIIKIFFSILVIFLSVSSYSSFGDDNEKIIEPMYIEPVSYELEKKNEALKIKNAGYHLVWVNKPTRLNKQLFEVLPCAKYPAIKQIKNPAHLSKMKIFIESARKIMSSNRNVLEINPARIKK